MNIQFTKVRLIGHTHEHTVYKVSNESKILNLVLSSYEVNRQEIVADQRFTRKNM